MVELVIVAKIAVVALVPLGAWVAMGEGMVLHRFSQLVQRLPAWMQKPLATCPRCMCSVWGISALVLSGLGVGLLELPVVLLAGIGLQEVLHR